MAVEPYFETANHLSTTFNKTQKVTLYSVALTFYYDAILNILLIIWEPGWHSRYSDWLRTRRPWVRSSESRYGQELSHYVVHTGSGAHPASYPVGKGGKAKGA
jgi:hypothetical protein